MLPWKSKRATATAKAPRVKRSRLPVLGLALLLGLGASSMGASSALAQQKHTVAEGQSLWKISKRYGVSVEAIQKKNDIEGKVIQPGQVLLIPSKDEAKRLEADKSKADKSKGDKSKGDKSKGDKPGKAEPSKPESSKSEPWYMQKPPAETQTQKAPKERGGVNPCLTADPGFGIYDPWERTGSMGQVIIPARGGVTKAGFFDVVLHFHGHEPARKEWVKTMDGTVFYGVSLGIGSGVYSQTFQNPQVFKSLLTAIEKSVAKKRGLERAKVRKVGLSAWSAGYGAVEQILSQEHGRAVVDSVILLDGLHSGYAPGGLNESQLEPFIRFARDAKAGRKLMFVSHSSIIPPGYASTTETANFLVAKLGGKPRATKPRGGDPMGLELNSRYDAGNFYVRGYDGNDKMDHCAHIGLFKDVLKVRLKPRWNSPKGYGPKPSASAKAGRKAEQREARASGTIAG